MERGRSHIAKHGQPVAFARHIQWQCLPPYVVALRNGKFGALRHKDQLSHAPRIVHNVKHAISSRPVDEHCCTGKARGGCGRVGDKGNVWRAMNLDELDPNLVKERDGQLRCFAASHGECRRNAARSHQVRRDPLAYLERERRALHDVPSSEFFHEHRAGEAGTIFRSQAMADHAAQLLDG